MVPMDGGKMNGLPGGGLRRRAVLKLIAATGTGLALSQATSRLAAALNNRGHPPAVIWVNQGGDDLNLLSLLGAEAPAFMDLVTQSWNLVSQQALVPTGFDPSRVRLTQAPIAVVETIPPPEALTEGPGKVFRVRLEKAKAAILVGTDACYGGATGSADRVADFERLCRRLKTPVIKLPGLPVPPHHLVGVLAHLEWFGFPNLDRHRRPVVYYGKTVCQTCERRTDLERGALAGAFGEPGCLLALGCKGPITHNTCSTLRWNSGENWCVGAGGPCTGCSEPGYPNHGGLGLYGALTRADGLERPGFWNRMEGAGFALLALAGAGALLQLVRSALFGGTERPQSTPSHRREG